MTRPCTGVLAEDEAMLRAELRETLTRLWPEVVIRGEAQDGYEALRLLETERPEVLFLDIEMPGLGARRCEARERALSRRVRHRV